MHFHPTGVHETRPSFRDRREAGERLAERLAGRVSLRDALVLAIPGGGVLAAEPIAERLGSAVALAPVGRLGVPWQPELAFGAVDVDGEVTLSAATVALAGLTDSEVLAVRDRARLELERTASRPVPVKGRPVVVVDDGLATGLTMRAAVRWARRRGAAWIVVAAPCAPPETVAALEREADEVLVLATEPAFGAIGEFYLDFHSVSEDEVRAVLARRAAGPDRDGGEGES